MDLIALQNRLGAMAGTPVMVIGDLMLDRFVHGAVSRVSAEAPVPILARDREEVMLGAAGNVARNLAALGGVPTLIGVVGEDAAAEAVTSLVVGGQIQMVGVALIRDTGRPTTTKTRFISAGQQLLRVDHEDTRPVGAEVGAALARAIAVGAAGARAILLSDYGKGVMTDTVIQASLEAAKASGAPLIVDSKARHFGRYGAADIVKPNAAELAFATDLPTATDTEIEVALEKALGLSGCRAILVTRSAQGMSLAERRKPVRHFRRPAPEVFDTAGAGDTALATLGLALASGAGLEEAVELALLASSVVVEKAGVAAVSPDELLEAEVAAHRAPTEAKIVTADGMVRAVGRWRDRGLKVGFTNGCFDILHPGHVAYLSQARSWCDRLIVGVNSDASVRRAKGEGRPVNSLEARALVLASLACVDLVTAFDDDTPIALIAAARPDLLVKGGDYEVKSVVGADLVLGWGGEVKIATFVEGHSTTATLAKAGAAMTARLVLVTGGAGFIGSHIVAELAADPSLDVAVCDHLGEADLGKWRNLSKHPVADFVSPGDLNAWLGARGAEVEAVIHMGAISSTTEADVDKIVTTNFGLSRDLFAWCASHGRRFIWASSAATYGDGTGGFDDDPAPQALAALRPMNAYGWSKALFDLHAIREAQRARAPPQWAGLKFFNVYGPNEGHKEGMRSVVAKIWPDVAAGRTVKLFKSYRDGILDGAQKRDFIHVRDAAQAVAWLFHRGDVNGLFNLGSGQARSFLDLATAVFQAAGQTPRIEYIDMPPELRDQYQYFTQARMERFRAAGYRRPFASLEEGVTDYVTGFLATADPYR